MNYADPTGLAANSCSKYDPDMMEVDQYGCIDTGGTKICIGPAALEGIGTKLGSMTVAELKALIGPEQPQFLRQLFGSGMQGAERALENLIKPGGLTNEAMVAYRELAQRAIANYEAAENAAAAEVQRLRLEILNRLFK